MTMRFISLYSGAGGLDLGLMRAGFTPALLVDCGPYACATLRVAVPAPAVLESDIHDVLNSGVLQGQLHPYTLAAGQPPLVRSDDLQRQVDPDGDGPQLLYRFMDVVAQARPAAFILVSIPALTNHRWALVMTRLRRWTRELGYAPFTPVLDAAEYGVPQHRDLAFLIGMPPGCKPDVTAAAKPPKVTAGVALRALKGSQRDISCNSPVYPLSRPELRNSPYSGNLLTGSGRMIDLRRTAPAIAPGLGGNKTPVLDIGQLESGRVPWIEEYHHYLWDEGGDPLRDFPPEVRMRRLTLRECAALQGFPPDYPLRGPALSQFAQVGAAVPPALGEAVGRAVLAGLA